MTYELAIGDRSYSSWSLRGWLMFARFSITVTPVQAAMYTPEFRAMLAGFGAARLVPALRFREGGDAVLVWDSLAMAETLAERHPDRAMWPSAPRHRGLARTLVGEMHSGFTALRAACPMNLRRSYVGFAASEAVRADLARIEELWAFARRASGAEGPWLFGAYSLADVFFAPVATRIATYGLPVGEAAGAYVAAHLADPAFLEWRRAGLAERTIQPGYDLDLPARPWPGPA